VPDYEDYFTKLDSCSQNTKDFLRSFLSIPIEGSRGCWWNKCTFCSLNRQYCRYREKSIDKVVQEVENQVNKYKCHSIRFVDNVQRVSDFGQLMSGLKDLELDLNIFVEMRAGRLKKEDYKLMRDAGVRYVQIGIEAFSNAMLQKMCKGVTTIENIAAIKHCQEVGILPYYNIIVNYPNEINIGLEESAENTEFLKSFVPPGSVHDMKLYHGSPVCLEQNRFNIKQQKIPNVCLLLFPKTVLQTFIPLSCDYTLEHTRKDRTSAWHNIFRPWMRTGEQRIISPLLYYQDTGDFLTVTDKLSENASKEILKGTDREIYLFCDDIRTKSEILTHFSKLAVNHLEEVLENWVRKKWMFSEEDKYLALAVRLSPMLSPFVYHSDMFPYSEEFMMETC